jgi:hypothetical protein
MMFCHVCGDSLNILRIIFDPRILNKNYGNALLRALPKCPVEVV